MNKTFKELLKDSMKVEVHTIKGVFNFPDLPAARTMFPTLDPLKNTTDFTWAMKGLNGHMRFEDWPINNLLST